jgi:4-hydroxybenzoate polyprenyltransferase
MIRALFEGFLFSSIYIASCAVIMAWQTFLFFGYPVNPVLLGFIFCGTITSYNFHWYLTPALAGGSAKAMWSVRHKTIHAILFVVGLTGAAWCGWHLLDKWYWLLLTAFVTFLYSAPKIPLPLFRSLRRIAVGKTVFLALAWTEIPFMLPLLFSKVDWPPAEHLFVFNRFFLIYAICIVFDYRDREADRRDGIRSLVTALDDAGINRLFWGALAVFGLSTVAFRWTDVPTAAIFVLAAPGVILALLYSHARQRRSDHFYYFVLDGLMMLSSLLLLVAGLSLSL